MLSKDTRLYLSLSEHPGNTGTYLFNQLFAQYKINAIYKACKVERGELKDAFAGFRALKIAGGGISMPFKREAATLVNTLEGVAGRLGVINTVKADPSGILIGYNTDYFAALKLLPSHSSTTYLLGAGGVAAAVALALKDKGYQDVKVIARRPENIEFPLEVNFERVAWEHRAKLPAPKLLFNCTPLGMTADKELEIPQHWNQGLELGVDLTYRPEGTRFANALREQNIPLVDGKQFGRLQAVEQFKIYTGLEIESAF